MAIPSRRAEGRAAKPAQPGWATPRAAAALVAALTVIAFARSLGNEFTYDEGLVIVRAQDFLRSGAFWALLSKQYFAASLEGTWRPFCTLTYMLDASLNLHPAVFRAQSLAWHIGTAWLLMALCRQLLPERHRRFALVAGLLFALHPVTTETVDNASFREDSLVTFFTLAMLLLALRRRPVWAAGAYLLALLSKESAVVAPVLLALIRATRPESERRPARAIAAELLPYLGLTAAYMAIRFGPMSIPMAYAGYPGGSLAATLTWMPVVWQHYLRLLIVPWPLCADYTGYFPFGQRPTLAVLGGVVVVLAYVAVLIAAARRGQTLLALGLGWFALALGPVSNFIPVPIPAAERFLYLPLAGMGLAAAAAAGALADQGRGRWLARAGAGLLGAFVVLINLRHGAWRDDQTLWAETVRINPRSCGAQSAVGGNLLTRGINQNSPALLQQAIDHQEMALSLCAEASDATRTAMFYTRLGAARAILNQLAPAEAALQRAMHLAPRYALPVVWMGYVRFLRGDKDQAADLLKRAVIDLGPPDSSVAEVAQRYVDKV